MNRDRGQLADQEEKVCKKPPRLATLTKLGIQPNNGQLCEKPRHGSVPGNRPGIHFVVYWEGVDIVVGQLDLQINY